MAWLYLDRLITAGLLAGATLTLSHCGAGSASPGTGNTAGTSGEGTAGAGGAPGSHDTSQEGSLCLEAGCGESIAAECDEDSIIAVFDILREPTAADVEGEEDPVAETTGEEDPCVEHVEWEVEIPPAPSEEDPPPAEETFECPSGYTRVHVRDMWSAEADPSFGMLEQRPATVMIQDTQDWTATYGARRDAAACDWYSTCVPPDALEQFQIIPLAADSCPVRGDFANLSADASSTPNLWIYYSGTGTSMDVSSYVMTTDEADVASMQCTDTSLDTAIPTGFTKLHIRYPWGDPKLTGFAGTACNDDLLGAEVPIYPSSLKVELGASDGGGCGPNRQAVLEFQNGHCPWYSILVPNELWDGNTLAFAHPDTPTAPRMATNALPLPERESNEYWLSYAGPPDDETYGQGTPCNLWSTNNDAYRFYTSNPGPGYAGCGSDSDVVIDPCNPTLAQGYHTVHFRYIWAGQKIFTYFPKPELMPSWMMLEVNGTPVICSREADRPWYNCPVPDSEFYEGAQWRAVDKTHEPEWNTVAPRPFPSTPGEYWVRWTYGKPDIPEFSDFTFYDYYPDATNGDWSATGDWNDENCAPKPPPVPFTVGYDGWFPYDETNYAYAYGSSLARTFPDAASVQDLLNAFVAERYEIWKENYLSYDHVCGDGTARVIREDNTTVSEGQGYGMAIAAAIGDKQTFDELWRFARHFLSQDDTKYCGGFMGWMWDDAAQCREIDTPCDPDSGTCGGNQDSAFDGDVDMAIGLVYAARQWPEYATAATNWLLKMECMINTAYDGQWYYPAPGDTFGKNCQNYPNEPCFFPEGGGQDDRVNLSYYPPGYFRVFGDYLATYLDSRYYTAEDKEYHRSFWYHTASTVYEMLERCYDDPTVHPALVTDWGTYSAPCSADQDNYNWARALWRIGVDAAWFGNRLDLPENRPGSSQHFAPKSRMQAKIDNIQDFYASFYENNPVEPNANRFSSICENLFPDGDVAGCDPAFGHNSYFVTTGLTSFVSLFNNDGQTDPALRREALEEAVSTTVINDRYYQESIGVYTILFMTGNFPNPMVVPQ